jgi:hypothetical protein
MARRLDALAFLRLLSGYFCAVMVSNCGHCSTGRPMPLLIHGPFTSEALALVSERKHQIARNEWLKRLSRRMG